jgi:hypothetical protein
MTGNQEMSRFFAQWFPTIRSFCWLYLGDEREGAGAAIDVFCEYLQTGLPFETDEIPLALWVCSVERVQKCAITNSVSQRDYGFDRGASVDEAVMLLNDEERLVFLLHAIYGLPTAWITLITGWSASTVAALCEIGSAQMRNALHQFVHGTAQVGCGEYGKFVIRRQTSALKLT